MKRVRVEAQRANLAEARIIELQQELEKLRRKKNMHSHAGAWERENRLLYQAIIERSRDECH